MSGPQDKSLAVGDEVLKEHNYDKPIVNEELYKTSENLDMDLKGNADEVSKNKSDSTSKLEKESGKVLKKSELQNSDVQEKLEKVQEPKPEDIEEKNSKVSSGSQTSQSSTSEAEDEQENGKKRNTETFEKTGDSLLDSSGGFVTQEDGKPVLDSKTLDSNSPVFQNAATGTEDLGENIGEELTASDPDLNPLEGTAKNTEDLGQQAVEERKESDPNSQALQNASTKTNTVREDGDIRPVLQSTASNTDDSVECKNSADSEEKDAKSEQVTNMITKRLGSEEYKQNLDKIDEIVKRLASSNLSPEDLQLMKDLHRESCCEKSTAKRKSKQSEIEECVENLKVLTKKCKLSEEGQQDCLVTGKNLCCLEEQFRLAFEEISANLEHKEYNFPAGGADSNYRLCKHQIAKIDAMVASAMSLDKYIAAKLADGSKELRDEVSSKDSKEPGCSSSARTRPIAYKLDRSKKGNKSKNKVPEDDAKWYGFSQVGKVVGSVKDLTLFMIFAGSVMFAVTVAKIFGIHFPANITKKKISPEESKDVMRLLADDDMD